MFSGQCVVLCLIYISIPNILQMLLYISFNFTTFEDRQFLYIKL